MYRAMHSVPLTPLNIRAKLQTRLLQAFARRQKKSHEADEQNEVAAVLFCNAGDIL